MKTEIEFHAIPHGLKIATDKLTKIIGFIINEINIKPLSLLFIFITDSEISKLHNAYLNDPAQTDVITFNLGEAEIEGEIYISFERATQQAKQFNVSFEEEIVRLMLHGLLHLAGYDDVNKLDRDRMKEIENQLTKQIVDRFF